MRRLRKAVEALTSRKSSIDEESGVNGLKITPDTIEISYTDPQKDMLDEIRRRAGLMDDEPEE